MSAANEGLTGWRVTNRHRGEVTLTIDGEDVPLRLTLQALAEIEAALDLSSFAAFADKLTNGLRSTELLAIAEAMARACAPEKAHTRYSEKLRVQDLPILARAVVTVMALSFDPGSNVSDPTMGEHPNPACSPGANSF